MKDHMPTANVAHPNDRPWAPATGAVLVVPHASNKLGTRPKYLRVNSISGGAALRMIFEDLSDVTLTVQAGEIIDARPSIVHTDTTAEVHAFY